MTAVAAMLAPVTPDVVERFRAALAARELHPPEIIADGRAHRCVATCDAGPGRGTYLLNPNGTGGYENEHDGRGWETFPREPTLEERASAEMQDDAARVDTRPLTVSGLAEFLAETLPPREPILSPIIMRQSLTMIHAWRGVGKTHVALGIAYAVASGGTFLRWSADKPRKVVYLDGEMPAIALQERLARIVKTSDAEPPEGFFRLATPDKQAGAMPDLAMIEGQRAVDAAVESDTTLIIVDNLSALVRRGGKENEAESWLTVAEWALKHRAQGRSILFVHHSGKNGQQRGTSKREDLLDTVISLRRPEPFNPADGAVFEVHFEKARGFYGNHTEPFEARLTEDAKGAQTWTIRDVQTTTLDRVIELHGLGLKQHEIAEELGINKSNVCRAIKKAEDDGRIIARPAKVARCAPLGSATRNFSDPERN
jgi:hypothetical protein